MTPALSLAWTAEVLIGEKQDLGSDPLGHRYLVPILGGSFEGPRLRGSVLAGGADRQWVRPDGVREFDALYEMQIDDGNVITVHNRVLVDGDDPRTRYARSVVRVLVCSSVAKRTRAVRLFGKEIALMFTDTDPRVPYFETGVSLLLAV